VKVKKTFEEDIVWDFKGFRAFDDQDLSKSHDGNVQGRATNLRTYTDYTAIATYTPSCQAYVVLTETIDAEGTHGKFDI
jgi:hypothetical protein